MQRSMWMMCSVRKGIARWSVIAAVRRLTCAVYGAATRARVVRPCCLRRRLPRSHVAWSPTKTTRRFPASSAAGLDRDRSRRGGNGSLVRRRLNPFGHLSIFARGLFRVWIGFRIEGSADRIGGRRVRRRIHDSVLRGKIERSCLDAAGLQTGEQ